MMKYLKHLKSFESLSAINTNIKDLNDILLELSDDDWFINVDYVPKRWENPSANYTIKSDYISVVIKKKENGYQSIYPDNSEFKFYEVYEYIDRIIDYFMTDDIESESVKLLGRVEHIKE